MNVEKPDTNRAFDPNYGNYRANPCQLEVGALGFSLFLVSLGVFFAAGIVSYLIVRSKTEVWPPVDAPPLPEGLWLSTFIILLTSASVQWGLNAIRRNQTKTLLCALYTTTFLSGLFLVVQVLNWEALFHRELWISDNLYAFTFYFLTGIHAAHVIGGILPLWITLYKAHHELYTSYHYNGIYYCALYWHFLDCVWVVLFTTLLLGS